MAPSPPLEELPRYRSSASYSRTSRTVVGRDDLKVAAFGSVSHGTDSSPIAAGSRVTAEVPRPAAVRLRARARGRRQLAAGPGCQIPVP